MTARCTSSESRLCDAKPNISPRSTTDFSQLTHHTKLRESGLAHAADPTPAYPFSSSHTSTLPPISLVDQFFVPSALIASIPNYVGPATKSTGMASTTFRIPQPVFQTLTTKFIKTWSSQFRTSSPADPNPSDSSTSHAIALCVCVWKPRFSLLSLLVHFTPISFCREMTMEAFAAVLLLWNLSRLTA